MQAHPVRTSHKPRWQLALGLLIAGSGSTLLAQDLSLWMRHSVC